MNARCGFVGERTASVSLREKVLVDDCTKPESHKLVLKRTKLSVVSMPRVCQYLRKSVIETLSQCASCYSVEKLCWACVGTVTIVTACQTGGKGSNPFPTVVVNGLLFSLQTRGCTFLCCHLSTVSYLVPFVISTQ